jgi:Cu-Zn family superoxide dismutase
MRYVCASALLVLLNVWPALASAQAQGQPPGVGAVASVRDQGGRSIATVTFREAPDAVLINLTFPDRTLTGTHGIQIHENGRCDLPDFASAGGIFNPFGRQHGLLNPDGPMAGDLPSLVMGLSGLAQYNTVAPLLKVGAGPAALLKPGGTSVVIYAQVDDDHTQPEGGAGARIACGVILPGPLPAGGAAPAVVVSQANESRPNAIGTWIIALGGILLIGVGVALRLRRIRL